MGLVSALAVSGAMVGANSPPPRPAVTPKAAAVLSRTLRPAQAPVVTANYTCTVPLVGKQTFSATVSASAPASIDAGSPMTVSDYHLTASLSPTLVDDVITYLGATSLSGSVTVEDVDASDASPATINAASSPMPFSVSLVKGEAAPITTPAVSIGPFVAGPSGTVDITPGAYGITGTFPKVGKLSIVCPLKTTPPPVVTSTTIVPVRLAVTTGSLPLGTVGHAYSASLQAVGGAPPYHWALTKGSSLPAGLVLDPSTGVISGTPREAGTWPIVVEVSDSG
ncbi:MAG: putative Ig domain-containing protein, partial [Acidimicrobiales bacterium]